ncbi:MAG: anti-sigma factor [Candidatus Phosphoribacter sp.]|nr:anti-sigma factor [Actinomycetales bacterium]
MTHPSDDALAGLLIGDDTSDQWLAEHVSQCSLCQAVVAELADVELLLTEFGDAEFPAPSTATWDRIVAATTSSSSENAAESSAELAPTPAPTDKGTGRIVPLPSRRDRARPSRTPWLTAAAAVALVVGGVTVGRLTAPVPDPGRSVATSTLTSLDGTRTLGSAEVRQSAGQSVLHVRPQQLTAPAGGFVEVWLINTDGVRMVSVGVLVPGQDATLVIPADALSQGYRIVDLSNEAFDDKPTHSGDSIMRGTLPT